MLEKIQTFFFLCFVLKHRVDKNQNTHTHIDIDSQILTQPESQS